MKRLGLTLVTLSVIIPPLLSAPKDLTFKQLRELESKGEIVRMINPHPREVSPVLHPEEVKFLQPDIRSQLPPSFDALSSRSDLQENVTDVYGFLFYTADTKTYPYGLYDLTDAGLKRLWKGIKYNGWNYTPLNGWYSDGKLCGISMDTDGSFIFDYMYYEANFQSGKLLTMKNFGVMDLMFYRCILNTDDKKIYGYVQDVVNGQYGWGVADLSNPTDITVLKNANEDYCYSLCHNGTDGYMYGVNILQQFVRIDTKGNQTVITDIPDSENFDIYETGLAWSAEDGLFYWNCNLKDYSSRLYSITPEGEFHLLTDFPSEEQFSFFLNTQGAVNPEKPMSPIVKDVSFIDNSLSGSVTFTIPKTFGDGSDLPSSLTYTAMVNGEPYSKGETKPGANLKVEYSLKERGMYTLGLYVEAGDKVSPISTTERFIGDDTPLAPENVVLTSNKITWKAVTKGEFDGYLDLSKMIYKVYLNEKYVGETTETSLDIEFDMEIPVDAYVGRVMAECNGYTGQPGLSNKIIEGKPFPLPAFFTPTMEEFNLMTIHDMNKDGSTWAYNVVYDAVSTLYSEVGPMDDYVFLPPVAIDKAGGYYKFSCECAIGTPAYPDEIIEVVYATSPDPAAVKGTIIESYTPTVQYLFDDWNVASAFWKAPEAGTYFIGIRCKSAPLQLGVYARNFIIESSEATDMSPAAPADLQAIPGEKGALNAIVSFVFPSKTINGHDIDATTLKAVIYADGEAKGEAYGKPGEKVEKLILTNQGYNTITVEVYDGELVSQSASIKVYTGYTVPAIPSNLKGTVNQVMYSATITWDPVTEAANPDGYLNPDEIYYTIWGYVTENTIVPYWEVIADNVETCSYEYTLPEGTPQDFYYVGVSSANVAGSNGQFDYVYMLMGQPYPLPFSGELDANGFTTSPWFDYPSLNDVAYNGQWSKGVLGELIPGFYGDKTIVAVGYPKSVPGKGLLGLPRITTSGVSEGVITLNMLVGPETADVEVVAQIYGSENLISVGKISGNSGDKPEIKPVTLSLPDELMNHDWVQLYITTSYSSMNDLFVMTSLTVSGGNAFVDEIMTEGDIRVTTDGLEIRGYDGKEIIISDLQGRLLTKDRIRDSIVIYPLAKGIYIVKVGNDRRKISVNN